MREALALSLLTACAPDGSPPDAPRGADVWPQDVVPFDDGPAADATGWAEARTIAAAATDPSLDHGIREAFLSHRRSGVEPPPPGGVGYGYWYEEAELTWASETAIVQAMVAPRTPGGDVTTYLYNTMTNRSNLGVEAFIAYFGQYEFQFRVFDWARYPLDPWQTVVPYGALDDYLDVVASPDGVGRQELLVVNRTVLEAAPTDWANEVYLYNRVHHRWDRIYRYPYTTGAATDNTYEPGDGYGSWGPIFETFQDHDGSNKPIGTNWTLLRQDGVDERLRPANTYRDIDDPDLDPPIFDAPSYGFAVGSTSLEPATTVLEAEDGAHTLGTAVGRGWGVVPADGAGVFVSRTTQLVDGDVVAAFQIATDTPAANGAAVATLEVWDDTLGALVGSVMVDDTDFADRRTRPFRVPFAAVSGHDYRFDVASLAVIPLTVDRIGIAGI